MYRVLGEIAVDGAAVKRRRERELFALLVAARGGAVSVERILVEVWADEGGRSCRAGRGLARAGPARPRALGALHGAVHAGRVPPRGRARAGGRWVFEDLAEQALAAPTPTDRLVLGTRAAELWGGEPYAECQATLLRAEASRLSELHGDRAGVPRGVAAVPGAPGGRRTPARAAHAGPPLPRAALGPARAGAVRVRPAGRRPRDARRRSGRGWPRTSGWIPSPLVRATERAVLTQDGALHVRAAGAARRDVTWCDVAPCVGAVRLRSQPVFT